MKTPAGSLWTVTFVLKRCSAFTVLIDRPASFAMPMNVRDKRPPSTNRLSPHREYGIHAGILKQALTSKTQLSTLDAIWMIDAKDEKDEIDEMELN